MKILVIIIVVAIVAILAFTLFSRKGEENGGYLGGLINSKKAADETVAKINCIELCQSEVLNRPQEEFAKGPCLSDKIIPDWVCDVVHSPREDVDNDQANQCPEFKSGEAHHFIEVDTNCVFIKAY